MSKSSISAYKSLKFGISTTYNNRRFFLKCAVVLALFCASMFLSILAFDSLDKIISPDHKPAASGSAEYYAEILGINICASWFVSIFGHPIAFIFSTAFMLFFLALLCALFSIGFGYIKICLDFADEGSSHPTQLLSQMQRFFGILIANLVFGFILTAGIVLFVIPAIFWYARFVYFRCIMVDKNVGIFTALTRSWMLTKGVWLSTLWFAIISLIVEVFGFWTFFTPFPVINLAWAHMYRQLENEHAAANNYANR